MAKTPMGQYDHQDPRAVPVAQPLPHGNRAQRRAAARAAKRAPTPPVRRGRGQKAGDDGQ